VNGEVGANDYGLINPLIIVFTVVLPKLSVTLITILVLLLLLLSYQHPYPFPLTVHTNPEVTTPTYMGK